MGSERVQCVSRWSWRTIRPRAKNKPYMVPSSTKWDGPTRGYSAYCSGLRIARSPRVHCEIGMWILLWLLWRMIAWNSTKVFNANCKSHFILLSPWIYSWIYYTISSSYPSSYNTNKKIYRACEMKLRAKPLPLGSRQFGRRAHNFNRHLSLPQCLINIPWFRNSVASSEINMSAVSLPE